MLNEKEVSIKIIGLGGIGSYLCDPLFRYLNSKDDYRIFATLIDGDTYEPKNYDRQNFLNSDVPKSVQKKNELQQTFPKIYFDSINEYINNRNVPELLEEKDFIFLCVDNHKSRKIVSDYVETLDNSILISGGNDYIDGNVQIFIKENGQKKLPSLIDYHPEISNANDKSPEEMSCEELQNSDPQLIFSNLFASTIMVSMFYNIFENFVGSISNASEVYFDITQMSVSPRTRKVK